MPVKGRRDLGRFDVAIVGSGFAGSILARCLVRRGMKIALVERARHPRFALGESSTPLGALSLERLAERYGLPDLDAMAAWGRWRRNLPELGRGLKRGFTFYRHHPGGAFANDSGNGARLLVAASPSDECADLHWVRADVDAALADRAAEAGAGLLEEHAVVGVEERGDALELALDAPAGRARLLASRVVDASGGAGVVARALGAVERPAPLASSLVYAHVEGLPRLAEVAPAASFEDAPYAEEAAAVHHLLDEGWLYVLRFDHGVASVGLVTDGDAGPAPSGDGRARLEAAAGRYPSLAASLAACRPVVGWRTADGVAYRLDRAGGERWLALPHTLGFVDPMFSTGIAWSLHAVERLIPVLLGGGDADAWARSLERDADRLTDLVVAARRAQPCFEAFVAVSWAYFAAASWLETRQRIEGG
ncbi:MAG TPA: FAD-dependent oxidoreductase, partial [Thermoanaerobaculia bacterium]|nr:FAD-dependent oxidoreductase [Thermoanaerobaculia bacterium]